MKFIIEEYGEVILAIVGSMAVLGLSGVLLFDKIAEHVLYIARGL